MTDAKFFAWDGDPGAIEAFKLVGFRPVVLAWKDGSPIRLAPGTTWFEVIPLSTDITLK